MNGKFRTLCSKKCKTDNIKREHINFQVFLYSNPHTILWQVLIPLNKAICDKVLSSNKIIFKVYCCNKEMKVHCHNKRTIEDTLLVYAFYWGKNNPGCFLNMTRGKRGDSKMLYCTNQTQFQKNKFKFILSNRNQTNIHIIPVSI